MNVSTHCQQLSQFIYAGDDTLFEDKCPNTQWHTYKNTVALLTLIMVNWKALVFDLIVKTKLLRYTVSCDGGSDVEWLMNKSQNMMISWRNDFRHKAPCWVFNFDCEQRAIDENRCKQYFIFLLLFCKWNAILQQRDHIAQETVFVFGIELIVCQYNVCQNVSTRDDQRQRMTPIHIRYNLMQT